MAQLARAIDRAPATAFVDLPASAAVDTRFDGPVGQAGSPIFELHQRLIETFETQPSSERKLPVGARLSIVTGAILLPWVAFAALYLAL